MSKTILIGSLLWGILIWLVGYMLGFVFFYFVPLEHLGWYIMPFWIAVILWVLYVKVKSRTLSDYLFLGIVWCILSMVLDYYFVVELLHPSDGYYKFDVYLSYALILVIPPLVYWLKKRAHKK